MRSTNMVCATFALAVCFVTFAQNAALALNPQPLPPKDLAKFKFATKLQRVALNPQPLPPGPPPDRLNEMLSRSKAQLMRRAAPELVVEFYKQPMFNSGNPARDSLNRRALNPQPLPPRYTPFNRSALGNFDKSALNPQPLPPRALY